jgi:hypothetical protein
MPNITDTPPSSVATELGKLSSALDKVVPPKLSGHNLSNGTWNIRALNKLTPKWRSEVGDSPIRDLSNLLCIAEIVRRFDVVAIQEVRKSGEAFLALMSVLGNGWGYLVTDVTRGTEGNSERLAFVFDRARFGHRGWRANSSLMPQTRPESARTRWIGSSPGHHVGQLHRRQRAVHAGHVCDLVQMERLARVFAPGRAAETLPFTGLHQANIVRVAREGGSSMNERSRPSLRAGGHMAAQHPPPGPPTGQPPPPSTPASPKPPKPRA